MRGVWIVVALVVACDSAWADPISYSESTDGDLGAAISSPTDLGAFAIGANVVAGRVSAASGSNDTDGFVASLGTGLQISGITIDVSNYAGPTSFESVVNNVLTTAVPYWDLTFSADGTRSAGSPPYTAVGDFYTNVFVGDIDVSFDYTITYDVESTRHPVPEPSTLVLMGLGIAGLVSRRRRHAA